MSFNSRNDRKQKYEAFQNFIATVKLWFIYLGTLIFFIMAIYYGICEYRGINVQNRFSLYLMLFCIFASTSILIKVIFYIQDKAYQKERNFDPSVIELPDINTIHLETALHQMSVKTSVILWDTVIGFFLAFLIFLTIFLGGNRPLILIICFALAVFLIAGHIFFSWRWRKKCFVTKMVCNTERFISIGNSEIFIADVEKSLMEKMLYYTMELILTNDYIIGKMETVFKFSPVAVPRAEIKEITISSNHQSGIMKCYLFSGNHIELLIGQGARMIRVLKVLNYYKIRWKEQR